MRVAFISPSGFGNLGDAAIQDTFIEGVRERLGQVDIVGITQNPPDTEERHHVRAVPMDVLAFALHPDRAPTDKGLVSRLHDGAAPSTATGVVHGLKLAVKEVLHWGIAFREMRRADVLAVSGGGQLDEHWGGPWRVPYSLWKWSLLARLLRTDVVVLSVGAGTTDSRLTRFFLRSTLRRARYASFRDERTAARVRSLGVSSPRVVPDLAFGHEGRRRAPVGAQGRRPRVAISPIAFLDPVAWPAKDVDAYRGNLRRTAELVGLLLDRGYDVVLCTSDTPDVKSARELLEEVGAQADDRPDRSEGEGTLTHEDTTTPAELLEAFAAADVAVASRLHGLILANLAGLPTVALSYDWKVDEHMRTIGLERYTFPIDTFAAAEVARAVDEMVSEREALATAVAERCELLAGAVGKQFDEVFPAPAP
jgi:polysaccharide pyruvyl transferase WcaK-like protein